MPDHKQPSKEELQENMEKALEELDKIEEQPPEEEAPEEEAPEEETPEEEAPEEEAEDGEEEGDDKENLKKKLPKKEEGDDEERDEDGKYKKRYQDSSREAQILYNKNKKMAEAIEKAGAVEPPTEEELTAKYPDWDTMSDFEKDMAKQNMTHSKQLEAIREATKDFKEMDVWNGKVDKFMADPETMTAFPDLEGKEEEFKLFSSMPTRRGVDFEVLVSSFLYEEGKKVVKKKGSMMPSGSAGDKRVKPNDGKLSVAESRRLRTADYKKYLEELKAGRIRDDI